MTWDQGTAITPFISTECQELCVIIHSNLLPKTWMPLHISQLQGTFYILHFVDGKSKDKLKKFILGGTKKKLGHQNLFSVLMIKVYSMCWLFGDIHRESYKPIYDSQDNLSENLKIHIRDKQYDWFFFFTLIVEIAQLSTLICLRTYDILAKILKYRPKLIHMVTGTLWINRIKFFEVSKEKQI